MYRYSTGEAFSESVLLSGDYEFLCHMYDLSGVSGIKLVYSYLSHEANANLFRMTSLFVVHYQ